MVSKPKMLPTKTLRRVAAECHEEHEAAVQQGRWRPALEAMLTGLIWRTIALALELQLVPAFNPKAEPVSLARELREFCRREIGSLTPTDDKADRFHKVRTIGEVLDGILDVVGVIEAWKGADPQEPFFLAVAATGLGQAEVELGLAESGHWEQVAHWQARKPGRGKWTNPWREEAAPVIQGWIDLDPSIKAKVLIGRLAKWLEDYGKKHPDEKLPDEFSLRKALDAMHAKEAVRLPWK